MIRETKYYKVKIDTPEYIKGHIVSFVTCSMYPDLFEPIYELSDGTEVCFGDLVWREKNGVIKPVKFGPVHVNQKSKVFGSSENCESWLEKNAQNIKAELLKQNSNSSFQTLKSTIKKLDDLENLSMADLLKIRYLLNTSIDNIEQN